MAGIEELIRRVEQSDYTAQALARDLGEGASSPVAAVARCHPDESVRLLAVCCLEHTGGPDAQSALLGALTDVDIQVAMAAARALNKTAKPDLYPALLEAIDAKPDPAIVREVALIIGRLGLEPATLVADLQKRYDEQTSPSAREGLRVALARLGDPRARSEFGHALLDASGMERKRHLEYCDYIRQSWLVPALTAVLDDDTPLVRVGVDGRPELIEALRACDIALVLLSEILGGAPFSFPVNRAKNYSTAERAEVRRIAMGQP